MAGREETVKTATRETQTRKHDVGNIASQGREDGIEEARRSCLSLQSDLVMGHVFICHTRVLVCLGDSGLEVLVEGMRSCRQADPPGALPADLIDRMIELEAFLAIAVYSSIYSSNVTRLP